MTIANGWLWVVFDNLHALGEHHACSPTQFDCGCGFGLVIRVLLLHVSIMYHTCEHTHTASTPT